ncbi:MAG: hypothetical protein R3D62_01180 [Xanthobacteraceae bacterium]
MGTQAKRDDPALWRRVKREITRSSKGGRPGQWSARKAQLAVQAYKRRGGGYAGARRDDNSLKQWTDEDWGTRSGRRSRDSGERYLPKQARKNLSEKDYARTTRKKRRDTAKGRQFSRQPQDIARRTAKYRAPHKGEADSSHGRNGAGRKVAAEKRRAARSRNGADRSKADLYAEARRKNIAGRSRMSKRELARALSRTRR